MAFKNNDDFSYTSIYDLVLPSDPEQFRNKAMYMSWVKTKIKESLEIMGLEELPEIDTIKPDSPDSKDCLYVWLFHELITMVETADPIHVHRAWRRLIRLGYTERFDFSYETWLEQQ